VHLIIYLLIQALDIYLYLIIASVIMSWLVMFDVLNIRNKFVYKGYMLLNRVIDPVMKPLRKFIPPLGNIDFTPMVVWFLIIFAEDALRRLM
jgi:YggT family protein